MMEKEIRRIIRNNFGIFSHERLTRKVSKEIVSFVVNNGMGRNGKKEG